MIPLEIVSMESLERELNLVRGAAAGSLAGVFGPRSGSLPTSQTAPGLPLTKAPRPPSVNEGYTL